MPYFALIIMFYHVKIACYQDLRLKKLSKVLTKNMIAVEGVESKHSTKLKYQESMISSSIVVDPII